MVEQLWAVGETMENEVLGPTPLHSWEFGVDDDWMLCLEHRCGVEIKLSAGAYLAGVIAGPVAEHHRQGCGS